MPGLCPFCPTLSSPFWGFPYRAWLSGAALPLSSVHLGHIRSDQQQRESLALLLLLCQFVGKAFVLGLKKDSLCFSCPPVFDSKSSKKTPGHVRPNTRVPRPIAFISCVPPLLLNGSLVPLCPFLLSQNTRGHLSFESLRRCGHKQENKFINRLLQILFQMHVLTPNNGAEGKKKYSFYTDKNP